MLVDSHCHLNLLDLNAQGLTPADIVLQARQMDVQHLLTVSVNLKDFPELLSIAQSLQDVSVSVGMHPNETDDIEPTVENLVELAQHSLVVAIGETGLDYFRSSGDLTWQHNRFRVHIQAGKLAHKPLIIHTRDARDDTIRIMQEENARDCGGVLHCFTETWEMAKAALDLGFYISFSGIVTFKNAKALQDVATRVPLDRLLIETDSPYLAPVPHRGSPNQPAYVRFVAEKIAELRGISFDEVAAASTENFFNLFSSANYINSR